MNGVTVWTFQDYVQAVWHFKWRALLFMAGALGLGLAYITYAPRRYESESKLFVRVGRENASLDPTLTKGETLAVSASREEEMNSIVEHLRSRCILERALGVLDPAAAGLSPEDRERQLQDLQNAVYISSPRTSTVVTVQGKGDSPEKARKIVATVVEVYLDEHMRMSRSLGSHDFLKQQAAELEAQLAAAQAELRGAKDRAGMASVDGRRTSLESQINALQTRMQQATADLSAAQARTDSLRGAVQDLPESILRQMVGGQPNDGLATMRDKLYQLQVHQDEVHSRYTQPHPVTAAVDQQVEQAASTLKREEPDRVRMIGAILAHDTASQASLAAEKENLQTQLAGLKRDLTTLNADEVNIGQLTLKVRQIEANYLACAGNLEEARKDLALQQGKITNLSVFEPATLSPLPVSPKKATALLLAGLAGLGGGLLMAVFSEQAARRRIEEEEFREEREHENEHEHYPPASMILSTDKRKPGGAGIAAVPGDRA